MRHWTNLIRTITPTEFPITLAQAKAHLRVTHDEDDDFIDGLIEAAVATIEGPSGAGIALLTQTWRQSFARPCAREGVTLPLGPIQEITAVAYIDEDGDLQTMTSPDWSFEPDIAPGRLYPAYGQSWPAMRLQPGALRVTFTAGYGGDAADVPADLRHALLLLVGHLYEHREATTEAKLADIPFGVESVLARYRVGFFG